MKIFLKQLNAMEFSTQDYYRIRKNKHVELRHNNKNNVEKPDTILVVDPIPIKIGNEYVFKCNVTYTNASENTSYNKEEEYFEYGTKNSYDILLQLDREKLFTDKNYYKFFMEKLLEEKRVKKYLEMGKETNPKMKCGNYIGYIDYNEQGGLTKYFNIEVGEKCHSSKEKIKERKLTIKEQLSSYNEELKKHKNAIKEIEQEKKKIIKINL